MVDNRAGIWLSRDRIEVTNSEGLSVYEVEMGAALAANSETDESRRARLYRERTQCVDCGTRIPYGAIYCSVDAPYGFWHWLKYFSAIRWHRRTESSRRGVDSR
jgi:hypothetical protein